MRVLVSSVRRSVMLITVASVAAAQAPSPDPRVGLKPGVTDAGEAIWNLKLLSATPPSEKFKQGINSDIAFRGSDVIQGNFNGYQIWDISNPSRPTLKLGNFCPASQSDVSTYKNLLFVSSEGTTGRIDCGAEGVKEPISKDRILGIRIFDITDLAHPKNVANVQTCRGSHTHTVVVDPNDKDNVYVYISGSSPIRPNEELPGCNARTDPTSSRFFIEVIKVPLAHPEQAAVVSAPEIFKDLAHVTPHGLAPEDKAEIDAARARGAFIVSFLGQDEALPTEFANAMLDSIVKARGGTGKPTGADSAALRKALPAMIDAMLGDRSGGPIQCHDITVYPAIGLAGGACEGYGLLIDIKNPSAPYRLDAVADSNFSYWHSATFNNDGTKVLFSDEWGGGSQPKCRATDPRAWGADALFSIDANRKMHFEGYYKLPAPQTATENCVAHNGSLIPIPGRDVMVQAWYQGGITVFDWTDAAHPKEIAFFDRGPLDAQNLVLGGSWSAYWYNGVIVSSEIIRGLDIFELTPSTFISQNEIDAAKTVRMEYQNTQGQPKFVWPASFSLARAYVDQLARSNGLSGGRISAVRQSLDAAEKASGAQRRDALTKLASDLGGDVPGSSDGAKVQKLAGAVRELAGR